MKVLLLKIVENIVKSRSGFNEIEITPNIRKYKYINICGKGLYNIN